MMRKIKNEKVKKNEEIFFQTFKLKNVKKQYTCTTLVVHTTDIRLD